MKKRKSGNSFKSLKEICQKNGIQFSNQPSNNLIIIDENGIEHIVDKHFNLFVWIERNKLCFIELKAKIHIYI